MALAAATRSSSARFRALGARAAADANLRPHRVCTVAACPLQTKASATRSGADPHYRGPSRQTWRIFGCSTLSRGRLKVTAAQEREGEGRAGVQTRLLKAEASADDQGASCCRNLGRAPGPLREAEGRRRCWQLLSAPVAAPPCLRSLRRWYLSRVSLLGFLRGQEMHNPELKLAKMGVTPNLSN